ncbi:dTDP-4-dehydrorhamnose 3,5-epimerase [Rhodoferax sp.]|uniref:dTDP-4-dehydrorhamnose 3,5-epimerase n=1 Tax=Rhodoferax sp. TaxID=50421 RepID=UPI001EB6723B|nr:dTDP-4-dehydrorhamnose 3,5-epimerase [Rhodoferax sp.]MBT9507345.1 dTDP-4-dehydrorhamnose 3,5-epimerase [Rhodoferax sp.]
MKLLPTILAGVFVAETQAFQDSRGAFSRLFCERELAEAVAGRQIEQINHSRTATVGAVRGLHFQRPPHAEMKMVRCLRGRVWDVAVDLRKGSPTFLQWHAQELSTANALMLVIPEGCAHGFQVLEPDSELLYLHTASYTPSAEGGLRFDDPALNIPWPLPVADLSERDQEHPLINQNFQSITV